MAITLSREQINRSIFNLDRAVKKYVEIQTLYQAHHDSSLASSARFMRLFNGYYRIGRKTPDWYRNYYGIFDKARTDNLEFLVVLEEMYLATGRYEASFCSKMVATINPAMPVIDSIVLKHLGLKLPYVYQNSRQSKICLLYGEIALQYKEYLTSEMGIYLTSTFRKRYPKPNITEIKMLDFVIWNNR